MERFSFLKQRPNPHFQGAISLEHQVKGPPKTALKPSLSGVPIHVNLLFLIYILMYPRSSYRLSAKTVDSETGREKKGGCAASATCHIYGERGGRLPNRLGRYTRNGAKKPRVGHGEHKKKLPPPDLKQMWRVKRNSPETPDKFPPFSPREVGGEKTGLQRGSPRARGRLDLGNLRGAPPADQ